MNNNVVTSDFGADFNDGNMMARIFREIIEIPVNDQSKGRKILEIFRND